MLDLRIGNKNALVTPERFIFKKRNKNLKILKSTQNDAKSCFWCSEPKMRTAYFFKRHFNPFTPGAKLLNFFFKKGKVLVLKGLHLMLETEVRLWNPKILAAELPLPH